MQFIGIEDLKMESRYLEEHLATKLKQEIIQEPPRWLFCSRPLASSRKRNILPSVNVIESNPCTGAIDPTGHYRERHQMRSLEARFDLPSFF